MTPVAIERAAATEAMRYYDAGHVHYRNSRINETIVQFDRARRIANSIALPGLEDSSRFWEGAALHGIGRIHEALSVWAPSLAARPDSGLGTSRYMMLTRYVLAAIDLPLPLPTIELALDEVESRLAEAFAGSPPRSRLLLARSRLALFRGRPAETLALSQEALVRRDREASTYSYSTHYRTLCRAAFLCNQTEPLAEAIAEWDVRETDYVESKRIAIAGARANLARRHGRWTDAVEHTDAVAPMAERSEDTLYAMDLLSARVRACMAAGAPARARSSLLRLLARRNTSFGDARFEIRLLLADYHLALAALHSTGQALDLEIGSAHEPAMPDPDSATQRDPVSRHIERARRAYQSAAREATRLDSLLECDHRTRVIAERQTRLADLERPALG